MDDYALLLDISGSLTWIGRAYSNSDLRLSSTIWQIARVADNTSGINYIYADNVTTFTKQWTERANYSYSGV